MKKIILFTQPNCKLSDKLKGLIAASGQLFEERDVSKEVFFKRQMIEVTGGRKTTPQVLIEGKHVTDIRDVPRLLDINSQLKIGVSR